MSASPCEVCRASAGAVGIDTNGLPPATWECASCHRRLCAAHGKADCPNGPNGHAIKLIVEALPFGGEAIRKATKILAAATRNIRSDGGDECAVPPPGWRCTRPKGHEGPCAAYPLLDGLPPPPPLVRVKRLGAHDLPLPAYKTAGAAGMDLHANVVSKNLQQWSPMAVMIHPGGRLVVGCGFALEIPPGWEGQVRPRSGLAKDYGLVCAGGTIDSDYRGEVGCNLFNFGREAVKIIHGDRVAQLVIAPAPQARLVEVAELTETVRGAGGFGSTGK